MRGGHFRVKALVTGTVLLRGLCALLAEPHPESGIEFWAIQSKPIPGEIIGFGTISKLSFRADDRGNPIETVVEIALDRVLRGKVDTSVCVVEEGKRFQDLLVNRRLSGRFLFNLQPKRAMDGYFAYWDGFGVREIRGEDAEIFARRVSEWSAVNAAKSKAAKRAAMMDWGLRCVESRITRWEGVLAIRDSINPGDEYREHVDAMKIVTPARFVRIQEAYRKIRDFDDHDQRIGTVMLEAVSWMTDDPLFHHEVRFWSAKLTDDEMGWKRHFDEFWQEAARHGISVISRADGS